MENERAAISRGYLNEEFRLYHLRDNEAQDIEYHFHEFDKIVVFISGSVSYIIEGKTYYLKPWDVLFIRHGIIHRPVISREEMYERIVLWMNREFLDAHSYEGDNLSHCFKESWQNKQFLLRFSAEDLAVFPAKMAELEKEVKLAEFGSRLMARTLFLQLMVKFNRCFMRGQAGVDSSAYNIDPKIEEVIGYINGNLDGDLSVEALSKRFFISKYHFMRKFKGATGFSVHSYVLQKRLNMAAELLAAGNSASQAAYKTGFSDYSSFLRAFKRMYNLTPRQFAGRKYKSWHGRDQENSD